MPIGTPVKFSNNAADLSTNSATVVLPTITVDGFASFVIGLNSTGTEITTPPAGWTMSTDSPLTTASTMRAWRFSKAVTSADSGATVTLGLGGGQRWTISGIYVPGSDGVGVFVSLVDDTGDTTLDAPAITPANDNSLRVVLAAIRYTTAAGSITTTPPGFTKLDDFCTTNTTGARFGGVVAAQQLTGQKDTAQAAQVGAFSTGARYLGWEMTFKPKVIAAPIPMTGAGNSTVFGSAGTATADAISFAKSAISNLAVGDLLLVAIANQLSSATTVVAPSGFTRIGAAAGNPSYTVSRNSGIWIYKVTDAAALAALPSTISFSGFSTSRNRGIALRITGVDLTTPVDVSQTPWTNGNTTDQSAGRFVFDSITTTTENSLLIGFEHRHTAAGTAIASTSSALTTILESYTDTVGATTASTVALLTLGARAAIGATGTFTATMTGPYTSTGGQTIALRAGTPVTAPPATPTVTMRWLNSFENTALRAGWAVTNTTTARMVVSASADMSSPVYSSSVAPAASGWVTARVTGLNPGTTYYVGIECNGTLMSTGRLKGRTLSTGARSFSFITGSCQVTGSTHAVFSKMAAETADFFIHQGDLHYADTGDESVWRNAFNASMTASTFDQLLAAMPMSYVWDNHDWAGQGNEADDWHPTINPRSFIRELSGEYPSASSIYKTWVNGRVRFVHIDQWTERDDDAATETATKRMISDEQEQWLYTTLLAAKEPVIVLVSHWPMYRNLGSGRWASYATQNARIKAWLAARPHILRRMIAVGGDSHDIRADDGTNQDAWGKIPTLNASGLDQSGGSTSATWNIASALVPEPDGVFSRCTITDQGYRIGFKWEAVDQTGAVAATWQRFIGTPNIYDGTLELPSVMTLFNGTEEVLADIEIAGTTITNPPPVGGSTFMALSPVGNGGGTTSGISTSPHDSKVMMNVTDTVGPQVSTDGGYRWARLLNGLTPSFMQRASGVTCDPVVPMRFWGTMGSGGKGGLWRCDFTETNAKWMKVSSGADAALQFNGSKPDDNVQRSVQTDGQPRHSSTPIIATNGSNQDIFLGTANDGAWRCRVLTSNGSLVSQTQFAGTENLYIQQVIAPINEGDSSTTSRLIIAAYDQRPASPSSAKSLYLSTNANGASPTASIISGSPLNIESLAYRLGTASGALPVVIATKDDAVYWCSNPDAATPTFTAFTGGPGAGATWISSAITTQGNNYVALVGAGPGGPSNPGGGVKGLFRGVWAQNASPSTAVWTVIGQTSFNSKMMAVSGEPDFALDKYSRPGNPAQVITAISSSKTNPNQFILSGRVCAYISYDYGLTWAPMPIPSGFGGFGGAADPNPARMGYLYATSSDYAFWSIRNAYKQPLLTLDRASGDVESGPVWVDPRDGYVGACLSGGGGSPDLEDSFSAIRMYVASPALANNLSATLSQWTEVVGANTQGWPPLPVPSGTALRPKALSGTFVYGSAQPTGNRTMVAGRDIGDGLMYLAPGGNYTRINAASGALVPFGTDNGFDLSEFSWHEPTSNLFVLDRGQETVWRIPINANGTMGNAVSVCRFAAPLTKLTNKSDCFGWMHLDPSSPSNAPRLVVSNQSGVWKIPNAHTAASSDMSVATKYNFTNTGQILDGKQPGMVRFHNNFLWIACVDFDSNSDVPFLQVTDPWGAATAVNVATSRTQGSLGFIMTADATYDINGNPGFFFGTYGAGRNGGYWWLRIT